jgi:hypothetical protein
MANHRHRIRSRHAGSFQIPDRCPPEIVRNPARTSRFLGCLTPGFVEILDGFSIPMKDPRDNLSGGFLDRRRTGALLFKNGSELRREREIASLSVFRFSGL